MSANLRSPNRVRTFSVASRFWSYSNSNHDYITLRGLQVVRIWFCEKEKQHHPIHPPVTPQSFPEKQGFHLLLFNFKFLIDSKWPKSVNRSLSNQIDCSNLWQVDVLKEGGEGSWFCVADLQYVCVLVQTQAIFQYHYDIAIIIFSCADLGNSF